MLREVAFPLAVGIVVLVLIGVYTAHAVAAASNFAVRLPSGVVDDADGVSYSRGWTSERGPGFGNGTAHGSSTAGAAATVELRGSQVMLYGAVGPNSGIARVSVDGGAAYEVDFFAPVAAGGKLLWVSAPLVGTRHRLQLRVTGTRRDNASGSGVDVDGFGSVSAGAELPADAMQFTYSSGSPASGGSLARTVIAGNAVDLRFSGGAAILRGGVSAGGRATVSVDGAMPVPLAASGGSLWSSGALKAGSHRVRVVVSAGSARVDSAWIYRTVRTLPLATSKTKASNGWVTFRNNPVVGKNWGTSFDLAALQQNGIFRMWFSWRPKAAIAYVESVDGVSWTVPRIVLAARPGTWEADVNRPTVSVTAGGGYDMWYTGQDAGVSAIGFATSADGLKWIRPSTQPVLTPQGWEKPSVMNASVLYDSFEHEYKMWYSGGQTQEPNAIGYATSPDGRSWTRYSTDPVLQKDPDHAWEQDRVAGVQVIQQAEDRYIAFYIGYRDILTAAIGVARSSDGIHWERTSSTPSIAAVPKTWDCDAVYKPFALWDSTADRWRLWFNGRCGGDEQLGMALHQGYDLF